MSDDRASYIHQRDPSIDRRHRRCPPSKFNLYKVISEDDDDNTDGKHSSDDNYSTAANSINSESSTCTDNLEVSASVYLRLRPTTKSCRHYKVENNVFKVQNIENHTTNNKDLSEKHFEFSNIFDRSTTQRDVYDTCIKSVIDNEENLTVLTYGTSGSGKTHTMHGTQSDAGVIPRAIEHIFTHYKYSLFDQPGMKYDRGAIMVLSDDKLILEHKLREKYVSDRNMDEYYGELHRNIIAEHGFAPSRDNNRNTIIWVSFAEIYNENVYDLLKFNERDEYNPREYLKRKNLKIISNDGNAFIKDLTSVNVRSAADAHAVLNAGLEQVMFASTNINQTSSRSHCIFMIHVINFARDEEYQLNTYKFCDLAGSERLKKTENVGDRLKEAQRINTSLLVLGRCLDMLHSNQQHKTKDVIPYRDSKLTLLLQAPLIGREKITTVVNMLPQVEFIEENLQVLNFASIAQKLVFKQPKVPQALKRKARSTRFSWFVSKNSPKQSQLNESTEASILTAENSRLEQEIKALRELFEKQRSEQVRNEQSIREQLVEEFAQQREHTIKIWKGRTNYLEETFNSKVKQLEDELRKKCDEVEHLKKQMRHALQSNKSLGIVIDDEENDADDDEDENDDDDEDDSDSVVIEDNEYHEHSRASESSNQLENDVGEEPANKKRNVMK